MATITNEMPFGSATAPIVDAETYEPAAAPRVVTLSQPESSGGRAVPRAALSPGVPGQGGHQGAGVHLAAVGRRQDDDGGQRGDRARQGRTQPRRRSSTPTCGARAWPTCSGCARTRACATSSPGARRSTTACGASARTSSTCCRRATPPDDLADDALRSAPGRSHGGAQAALRLRDRRHAAGAAAGRRADAVARSRRRDHGGARRITRRRSW